MSTTPNLLIPLIAQSQNLKEVTFNTAIDTLDEAMCSNKSEALTGTTTTLPQSDFNFNGFLKFTGALTGDNTITLPSGIAKIFMILNATTGGHNLKFKVGSGSTVTISDANPHLMYSDGVSVVYQLS
jgi:hypothetical protein